MAALRNLARYFAALERADSAANFYNAWKATPTPPGPPTSFAMTPAQAAAAINALGGDLAAYPHAMAAAAAASRPVPPALRPFMQYIGAVLGGTDANNQFGTSMDVQEALDGTVILADTSSPASTPSITSNALFWPLVGVGLALLAAIIVIIVVVVAAKKGRAGRPPVSRPPPPQPKLTNNWPPTPPLSP